MKSNTCTKQGNTHDPESNALNPAGSHEKTWGSFAIINIWADDVQLLFGYALVASLFISYGVGGWTAFAGLITAGLFVMWMVNLSGAPGEKYGIPDPELAGASLGTEGARLPAMLRSMVAIFWYGVQVALDRASTTQRTTSSRRSTDVLGSYSKGAPLREKPSGGRGCKWLRPVFCR